MSRGKKGALGQQLILGDSEFQMTEKHIADSIMSTQPLVLPSLSALSSSSTPHNGGRNRGDAYKRGSLSVEVLSAYDLPYAEAPQCVTLTTSATDVAPDESPADAGPPTGAATATATLKTGPPLARHKNRNSFRFSAPSISSFNAGDSPPQGQPNNPSTMEILAPLQVLYKSTVTIRVVYANREPLETTYDLRQLKIHESKWLILNLCAGNALASDVPVDALEEEIPPTIRVKLTLAGPYRPEIAALVSMAQSWFALIDATENHALEAWNKIPKPSVNLSRAMALPTVPLVATILVASPLIAAIFMLALPFLLPVVLLVLTITAAVSFLGVSLFFSTRIGRDHLAAAAAPITDSLLSSRAGQTLIYDTGPRPTPVSVAKQILPTSMAGKLVISLLIDLIGSSSYLLPVVGEGLDIAWAPIQTVLIMAMYNSVSPSLKYVSFFEEILPFTDIVPTATIGFLCEFVPQVLLGDQDLADLNKIISSSGSTSDTIQRKND